MKLWLAVLLLGGILAACQPVPDTGAAEAAVCTSLSTMKTAVGDLANTSATTTVGDLKEAHLNVQEAWSAVQGASATLDQAQVNELEDAFNSLGSAVNDIPDDATIQQASDSIQDELATVNTAWTDLNTAANCP
jgi:hypothetical protein